MPRILQINIFANLGSTGRIAEGIGETLIKNGWESLIAFGRGFRSSNSKLIKIGNFGNVLWHVFETRIFDNHGLASKNSTLKFIAEIEKLSPDLIHLHNIHGYYLNFELLFNYLSSKSIPVVWTLHDCWSFTGHCSHFESIDCNKWTTGCFKCPLKTIYPSSLILDRSRRNYNIKRRLFNSISNLTIVPVSNWLGTMVSKSFLNQHKVQVIPNGIDISTFRPQTLEIQNNIRRKYRIKDKYLCLGVANIWPESKGLNDFKWLRERLNEEFAIMIVGLSKSQINNLPVGMIGIERTESVQELAELYSTADTLVCLSREESFGLVLIEAMACGTPVLGYNSTAVPELITEETGIIVSDHNIESVAIGLNQMKIKGKSHFTEACRSRMVEYYNKDDRNNDYFNLYNSLLYS